VAQWMACRRRCGGIKLPATPGVFADPKVLVEPFVTLSTIEAGRAYLQSWYLIQLAIRSHGEDVLQLWGTDVPLKGAISSDLLARILGYENFVNLVDAGAKIYPSRL